MRKIQGSTQLALGWFFAITTFLGISIIGISVRMLLWMRLIEQMRKELGLEPFGHSDPTFWYVAIFWGILIIAVSSWQCIKAFSVYQPKIDPVNDLP